MHRAINYLTTAAGKALQLSENCFVAIAQLFQMPISLFAKVIFFFYNDNMLLPKS